VRDSRRPFEPAACRGGTGLHRRTPSAGCPARKKFPAWGIALIVCASLLIPMMILAAIAIPVFLSERDNAQRRTCQANLRTIDGAVMTYYAENEAYPPAGEVGDSLVPDFIRRTPTCPTSGREYVLEEGDGDIPTSSCPTGEPGHSIWPH
jgi:hypothetical protein